MYIYNVYIHRICNVVLFCLFVCKMYVSSGHLKPQKAHDEQQWGVGELSRLGSTFTLHQCGGILLVTGYQKIPNLWNCIFHRIHVWYIYLHLPQKSTTCRYIPYMVPMGFQLYIQVLHPNVQNLKVQQQKKPTTQKPPLLTGAKKRQVLCKDDVRSKLPDDSEVPVEA